MDLLICVEHTMGYHAEVYADIPYHSPNHNSSNNPILPLVRSAVDVLSEAG